MDTVQSAPTVTNTKEASSSHSSSQQVMEPVPPVFQAAQDYFGPSNIDGLLAGQYFFYTTPPVRMAYSTQPQSNSRQVVSPSQQETEPLPPMTKSSQDFLVPFNNDGLLAGEQISNPARSVSMTHSTNPQPNSGQVVSPSQQETEPLPLMTKSSQDFLVPFKIDGLLAGEQISNPARSVSMTHSTNPQPNSGQVVSPSQQETEPLPLMTKSSQDFLVPFKIDGLLAGEQISNPTRSVSMTDSTNPQSNIRQVVSPSQQEMEPHAVSIDILSAAAEEKLHVLPPSSSWCCIYTVPDRMRYSNERHYTPRVVSIGPIHYHNEKLKANAHLKERYLAEFRQHTTVRLNECYKLILNQETKLRNYYADVIKLDKKDFANMVLEDAAFLLMILVYTCFRSLVSSSDKLFKKPNMMLDIMYDILLLENQLPLFILEDLYKLSRLQNILGSDNLNFGEENAVTYLGHQFCMRLRMTTIPRGQPGRNALHILDMLRNYLIPADWTPERKLSPKRYIPNTKELHQAGLKIHVGSKKNMFDIRFRHGILEVPPLVIDDTAELIFRNLLAFELCHCHERIFSDYFEMMRLLTISPADTELMIETEAIDNALPNAQQVSTLFQSIGSGNIIDWSHFMYSDVIEELNKYYKIGWHKWKATLKEKYFKAPWAICSVSVAALLLALTIAQTVLSILQVALHK